MNGSFLKKLVTIIDDDTPVLFFQSGVELEPDLILVDLANNTVSVNVKEKQ